MAESKNLKLPVTYDKCPVCGGKERLGEKLLTQLKQEGSVGEAYPLALLFQIPIADQDKMKKTAFQSLTGKTHIKVIQVSWDVCANPDCGVIYCTKFEVLDQEVMVQMQPQPGNMPPVMNRDQRRHPAPFPFMKG